MMPRQYVKRAVNRMQRRGQEFLVVLHTAHGQTANTVYYDLSEILELVNGLDGMPDMIGGMAEVFHGNILIAQYDIM